MTVRQSLSFGSRQHVPDGPSKFPSFVFFEPKFGAGAFRFAGVATVRTVGNF
jgi:hypothetical protein